MMRTWPAAAQMSAYVHPRLTRPGLELNEGARGEPCGLGYEPKGSLIAFTQRYRSNPLDHNWMQRLRPAGLGGIGGGE